MEGREDGIYLLKLFGAVLVMLGCGGAGVIKVAAYRYQVQTLQQLIRALEYMVCELQYRMSPLPELCQSTSQICTGVLKHILQSLGQELTNQITPDAQTGMTAVVLRYAAIPDRIRKCLLMLGDSLGRFDLNGQLQGLHSVKKNAEFELEQLRTNQDLRLRSYQTLGICAGAALVVLFL